MARKTPGIYIAIRGDYSAFETDLNAAKKLAKVQGDAIAKSINNAVSAVDLTGGINKITRELKTAQAALSAGAFKGQVSGLEEIAKAAGVSSKQLEGLTNSMLKSQAAASADRAFEYLQRNAGLSARELAKLRRELGDTQGALKTAMGALNTRSHSAIVSEMKDIVASYREVKNSADATANDVKRAAESMRGSLKRLASEARATKVSPTIELTPLQQALASVQRTTKLSTQEIERLSAKASQFAGKRDMEQAFTRIRNEAGLSTVEMAKLRFQLGDTSGALSTLMSGAKAAAVPVLAVGAAFGVAAKASFDATLKLDSTTAAFESITGSAKAAQEQLSFIRELSDRLGLSFLDTAQSAKTIFASAESTGLGMEKAQKAFQAVATAGTALKLTTDQMNRLNLAVSQVISKGRPMAEEMRQQIGEVLPGAMGLFATSIGVTGKELDKMFQDGKTTLDQFFTFLDALQNKYEEAAENASHSMQAELGRLKTSWDDFLVSIGDSDAFASITRGLSKALDTATGVIKESELPNAVANLFKNVDVDVSGPTRAAAQIESEIAGLIAAVQKMTNPMDAAAKASEQLEASIRSQAITLDYWLSRLPDERFFTGIFGTLDELTPATREAFDEIQKLIAETQQTHHFQNFSEQLAAIGKRLETEGEMTVRFRGYLEELQKVASRGVTVQLQLEGKEKFLQELREVWQAWRLQNDPALATQKQWKANFDALIAGRNQAVAKEVQATTQAIERVNKVYDKSAEGKKKHIQDEINAIINERDVFAEAVRNGTRTQKEFDEYSEKSAAALKKLREDQQKSDKKGAKSAEAAANRAAKALAVYDEEIAKLTQSSRELEQVKIEEKLAKIAKDAKLPAAEMEKLRKAMEHEADFKWMQDILSYADPAAAAVAKVDKEYEAFLRNVEYLKKTDPAKYTQLMTKAETEHEKALRKAERASKEQNEHLQEKLSFYKELEEMSGAFGLSLEVQNRLLDEQMEIFRDADIPENLIQTWRQYKDLMNSHDWADGAQRAFLKYRADATDAAKGAEEAFSSLYSGMDSGWKSAWEQMIETSRVSLSSFRSVFVSFLADLMHMAITRPITVQIAGVVSGMLGTGGVAYAAGGSGGVGGIGNLSGLSNFMPGSWFSGIGNTINDTMAGWFPGTFAMSGAAGTVMTPVVGAADIAGLKAAEAAMLGGNAGGGMAASGGTFLSTVSPYLMAGGLGSLGYTMLGGALGLPQSKYSGLTAGLGGAAGWGLGSLAAGSFASIGATMGSVVPVVGTIIGALAGGALGSLFGQERKTHPSVYGHMMGQGYTTDTQAYIDAFMNQATYDRAGKTEASAYAQVIGEAASQTAGNILNLAAMLPDEYKKNIEDQLESATWSAGRGFSGASWNIQNWKEGMAEKDLQEAIGDMFEQMGYGANKAFAEAGIGDLFDSFDLSTEEGFKKAQTAISAISSITTAIDEIKAPTSEAEQQAKAFVAQMDALGEAVKASGLNAAYADEMLSDYRTAYVDNYVNSLEEMFNPLSQIEQQAKGYKEAIDGYVAALTTMGASEAQLAQVRGYTQDAIDNITGSLDAAFFPLSEVETQTKATMESLLAYKSALETLGASAEELTRIDAAWGKMQSDLLGKARAYVSTTPEVVTQTNAMNAEFDALRKAMELAGNATADLTELEETRAQAVAALQAQYAESFRQTYAQRYATLTGDTNGLANLQQQASFSSELAEIEKTWGKDSEQYRQMQALQDAEAAKQRLEQAQTAYAALQAQLEKQQAELKQLEQQAVQLQIEEIQKLQTASKERIAALEKELSAAQKLHDTWEDVFATAYAKHVDLYQGNTNLDVFGRLDTAQGEFDRLYGLAIGGDADAAKEMAGVASELLGLRGETTANRDDYLDAFYDVDKKLKEVSAYADAQVSDAQKQIDTLQAQLEAENAQYSILVSQLSAQQAALSALNGQTQTLASIQAQIAKLKTEINITIDGKNVASSTVGNAQGDYDDAKDHVDQTKPVVGIYGSKYLTEYDLLVAKVASLNATKVDGRTDWTVADARKSMLDWYGSIEGWYKDAGKREGFEHGGLATPGGPKMFGERGIEYGDVEQPTRIYDATKTRLMLEGGHEYAREAYKGMSEFSRMLARTSGARGDGNKEETAALRKEVREMRGMLKAMLTSVVKNTKDVRDFLEEFEETGLPPQRVNA